MKLSRRNFLSLLGLQYISLSAQANELTKPQNWEKKLSILQGMTDHQSVEFSCVAPKKYKYNYAVEEDGSGNLVQAAWLKRIAQEFSKFTIDKFYFEGLKVNSKYQLHVLNKDGSIKESRNFGLLDQSKKDIKFVVGSCMNDYFHNPHIWKNLVKAKPDIVFLIGDSVYADLVGMYESKPADGKQLWNRFVQSRNKLEIYHSKNLLPILSVWDDHDYGDNDSDKSFPHKAIAAINFQSFFAQDGHSAVLEKGPGISSYIEIGGQNFFLLDGRSFRDESKAGVTGELGDFFGREQEQWLFEKLKNTSKPTWLLSGSQWFGASRKKESYEYDQPESFRRFLSKLSEFESKIIFVSGDVHFSEIMEIEQAQLGYPTIEITSSSIHSLTFPGWHLIKKNPRRVRATSAHNFILIQAHENNGNFVGNLKSINSMNRSKFSYDFEV